MKQRKMSQREKKLRAEAKARLQQEGVIPPDKPRLNRKKFAKEVLADWEAVSRDRDMMAYLYQAIFCMVGPNMREVTLEDVGVLKVLKIAVESKRFQQQRDADGLENCTIMEFLEQVVFPIRKL